MFDDSQRFLDVIENSKLMSKSWMDKVRAWVDGGRLNTWHQATHATPQTPLLWLCVVLEPQFPSRPPEAKTNLDLRGEVVPKEIFKWRRTRNCHLDRIDTPYGHSDSDHHYCTLYRTKAERVSTFASWCPVTTPLCAEFNQGKCTGIRCDAPNRL